MFRLLMIAMLLSLSIEAANLTASENGSEVFQKNCKCKRGHTGPLGPSGPNGAAGPTGPTGAAGLSTPNIIMAFTSGASQIMSSITPPFLGEVILLPFGGAPAGYQLFSNGISGPQLVQRPIQNYGYNISQDIAIVSIAGTFTLFNFVEEPTPGSEITPRIEIWVAPSHSNIFSPSGAGVDFQTLVVPETPSDLDQTTLSVGPTALNVPIASGSRILMVCSITSEEFIRLRAVCTAGISMAYPSP